MVEYILKNYNKPYTITLRQLDVTSNENYRAQLWRVKKSEDKNILLCSSIESLPEILKQAQQVGLLTNEHQFIITSLDMHTVDLEPFQYSGTNITGFRMVSPHDPFVQDTTEFFKQMYLKDRSREDKYHTSQIDEEEDIELVPVGLTAEMILLQTALTYDAVSLFHKVMAQHVNMSVEGVKCDNSESIFVNGTSIFNSMKTFPPFRGLSGDIQVDQHGNRENFHLEILELASEGLKQIGTWNSTMKIQTIKGKPADVIDHDPNSLKNKTLTVLIAIVSFSNFRKKCQEYEFLFKFQQNPYAMRKENIIALEGNDQYEGFAVELIEKLAAHLEFSYIFDIEPKVGQASDPTRNNSKWSGMIGRLMDDTAHLAICDLTITAEREAVIDFTMPFMTLGISILYEKAKPEDPKMFSFLDPLDPNVWGCLFGSFFMVSLSLFIMGRLSPAEWDNPYPCIEEPEVLINQFSFKNAMWFTIGALLQQGSEIAPKYENLLQLWPKA